MSLIGLTHIQGDHSSEYTRDGCRLHILPVASLVQFGQFIQAG
jgi:hypothetical protein